MTSITVQDLQRDADVVLRRVESGETVIVVRDNEPVAEITPVGHLTDAPRPFGLCAGEFSVPDDFDAPLLDEIIHDFDGQ